MSIKKRSVKVHHLPQQVTSISARSFLHELQNCAETERPRFVLDCSKVSIFDNSVINLLLSSLEAVMKCNGDLRLAGLNSRAESVLRQAGIGRLFEMYETVEDAVQSFHRRAVSMAPLTYDSQVYESQIMDGEAEYAA